MMRTPASIRIPDAWAGTAYVALAAVCWGLSGGIAGMLINGGWDPLVVSFYRGAIGLLFVAGWLALRPRDSGFGEARLWAWSSLAGLAVAGNFSFYFVSIAHGNVSVAATLMYCAPLFVYLASFALGIEQPTALKWLGMLAALAGIALLTGIYDQSASGLTGLGIVAGLLSGLSYAIFIFAFRSAGRAGSPQAVLTIAFVVFVMALAVIGDPVANAAVWRSEDLPLFLLLGILGAGLSFILFIRGVRFTAPPVASAVAMAEPVSAALFGAVVLGERLSWAQQAGMVIILVAVTTLTVYSGGRYRYRRQPTS